MQPERELLWLRRVRDLSHALTSEAEVETLLPRILDAAIELSDAERGFLVRVQGKRSDGGYRFRVAAARGFGKEELRGSPDSVSRTVVRRAVEHPQGGLVTTREEDGDLLEVESVRRRRVRSIICATMRLRGEVRGVLYLDHRFEHQAFGPADLPILRTFADQAALALEMLERPPDPSAPRAPEEEDPNPLVAARAQVGLGRLVGTSPAMRALYREIERAARSADSVLVTGESGVGKELVAREIHARGATAQHPFLCLDPAALPDGLTAPELFGARAGAYTGAREDRPGLLARAGRGTLFLDAVDAMRPTLQAQLLRVLCERAYRPLGSGEPRPLACRIVAATNADLRARVSEGAFREDLYYRLDVLRIRVPALRERRDDLPLLVEELGRRAGRHLRFTPHALELLGAYSWPGNVRELENELRRLAAHRGEISARQLSPEIREGRGLSLGEPALAGKTLGDIERSLVERAVREAGGNKSRAARLLGIPRSTLYGLLKRYDIS